MTHVWDQGNLPLSKAAFVARVYEQGADLYRDLPWRNTRDAYAVLVSEVMLQQTQVSRVLTRWERFLARFPTVDALAAASTSDVLEEWQGMGYNRRALALKRMADECALNFDGEIPPGEAELLALPGVGPATAAGVRAFAFNEPGMYLETNVRTVFLYELFPQREGVKDKELAPLVREACPENDARTWYYALLDYGAHLKATTGNANRRSAQYTRQSAFEGSHRQKRAELTRIVLAQPGITCEQAFSDLNDIERAAGREALGAETFSSLVAELAREGFFTCENDCLIP